MKIWQRYLLKEFIFIFILFLSSFYLLYSIIDCSLHIKALLNEKSGLEIFLYYGYQFIKRCDILIPLAFLVSTIKVLYSLSCRLEFLALQASGIHILKLLSTFFLLAIACVITILAIFEYSLPNFSEYVENSEDSKNHFYKANSKTVNKVVFKDGSALFYQNVDSSDNSLLDVFWVKSNDDIWHAKKLFLNKPKDSLVFVDHIQRDGSNFLNKTESFETLDIKELSILLASPSENSDLENLSLSNLLSICKNKDDILYVEALTQLYLKITLSCLPILVFFAISPFCLTYSRKLKAFFLYAISVPCLIIFYIFIDTATILGENKLFTPGIAIAVPFGVLLLFFSMVFVKKLKII